MDINAPALASANAKAKSWTVSFLSSVVQRTRINSFKTEQKAMVSAIKHFCT